MRDGSVDRDDEIEVGDERGGVGEVFEIGGEVDERQAGRVSLLISEERLAVRGKG